MAGGGAEDVGGAEEVRRVIVEASVVEEDGEVDVVELEEMGKCSETFVSYAVGRDRFGVVDGDWGEGYWSVRGVEGGGKGGL